MDARSVRSQGDPEMPLLYAKGTPAGADTDALAKALLRALGNDASAFTVLADGGNAIDDEFAAAIRRWQAGVGIIADGIVGPRCQVLLGLLPPQGSKFGPF